MQLQLNTALAMQLTRATNELYSPWSSADWREYFRLNAVSLLDIPWELGVYLTPEQRDTIAASLQQFQLGESSDGLHLINVAREHAAATGDRQYLAALRRFIAEEQRHGRDLGRVLDLAGIPRITHCWADSFFRFVRKRGGLEWSISILVTAEIIAQVYYIALRDATDSLVLRHLCQQVLHDEDEHVRFQCERLAVLRQSNRAWRMVVKQVLQRFFFAGTCLVFWWKHSPVMRAGGFGYFSFSRAARKQMRIALRLMDPRRYRFVPDPSDPLPRYSGGGPGWGPGNGECCITREPPPQPSSGVPGEGETSDALDLGGKWLEL